MFLPGNGIRWPNGGSDSSTTSPSVKIDGDRATATVTYHFDKAPDDQKPVSTMTFVREDGAWKVCSTGPS